MKAPVTKVEGLTVIGFKDAQGGVEQLTLGDDDDVKARRDVVATENLSNQSFSPVSLNGSAELFRRRDAETSYRALVGEDEHCRVAPMDPGAAFIHFLKLGTAPDALVRPEPRQVIRC